MLVTDVHYDEKTAWAAGILLKDFNSAEPLAIYRVPSEITAPYIPGSFYLRELPPLLKLLRTLDTPPGCIVVDGYVWLDEANTRPGLGAKLYESLEGNIPVIGIAKRKFGGISPEWCEVSRGRSASPLYVTAAGVPEEEAKAAVRSMVGEGRIPWAMRLADRIAKGQSRMHTE